jgi:hypothetical protein
MTMIYSQPKSELTIIDRKIHDTKLAISHYIGNTYQIARMEHDASRSEKRSLDTELIAKGKGLFLCGLSRNIARVDLPATNDDHLRIEGKVNKRVMEIVYEVAADTDWTDYNALKKIENLDKVIGNYVAKLGKEAKPEKTGEESLK